MLSTSRLPLARTALFLLAESRPCLTRASSRFYRSVSARSVSRALAAAFAFALVACGGDAPPPEGAAALKPWLEAKSYAAWDCQPQSHPPLPISPHLFSRVCVTTQARGRAVGRGDAGSPFPNGAAAVKELLGADGKTPSGYAVTLKIAEDSADGAGWYYYEEAKAIDPSGPIADGRGDDAKIRETCANCHSAAGKDESHPGHDFMYSIVE